MRYLDPAYPQLCARLTGFVRHDESDLARAVRDALADRNVDAGTSAVADFCPESASLKDGAPFERHHLVVVDHERHAFVGLLERSASAARFIQWRRVPSAPIVDRDEIIRSMAENRRERRRWNADIDSSITDPKDVLYNELIEVAFTILDGSSAPTDAES